MKELLVATISMCSGDDKSKNVDVALSKVREAAKLGAKWVLLPEIFSYHGPYHSLHDAAEYPDSPLLQSLSGVARETKITLFAGSVGERPRESTGYEALNAKGDKKVHNTMFVFGPDGSLLERYRKTHLFNLLDGEGKALYCESEGFIPGHRAVAFEHDGWRVGLAICYDLRFPEFFGLLAKSQALDIIVIPSAFTEGTGKDHWEVLLRARAIEHQCYVLASNQCGEHRPGKRSYGHSMIIDPWGCKIADTGDDAGIALAVIGQDSLQKVRARLPALANKRRDLY
ncbi:carbon-nitrogen hydrolase family protein [Pseudobacteriovorax antillogorgiicola]|uniref:Predicted amidohydrolase n=1 Tax=Pseudobacteriovorax antillogorgiicola TaxID=1513793 RepID=A0A1Y6CK40_9BACT|nr:carbon-nitrogen hydrolase family protein [Pseudobacteriovorax antillogorgiicola]TCS46174.1 putative amidohydrolase [Pseudobacteriovorax antillogorgiicola]SMF69992.1 Predicted amidohydrolase [Pseudobacteriovorax antillogorgiicola]